MHEAWAPTETSRYPVEQASEFELVVNLRAAHALGIHEGVARRLFPKFATLIAPVAGVLIVGGANGIYFWPPRDACAARRVPVQEGARPVTRIEQCALEVTT